MFDVIIKNIRNLFKTKRLPAAIVSIIIFLFCAAFIIVLIQHRPAPKTKALPEEPFVPDQKVLIPDGPQSDDGYYPAREPKEKWSQSDAQEWFTDPEGDMLNELESTNDAIASDITGAAP